MVSEQNLRSGNSAFGAYPQSDAGFASVFDKAPRFGRCVCRETSGLEEIRRAWSVCRRQVMFLGRTSREEHLAAFKDVDISLDPFPQTSGEHDADHGETNEGSHGCGVAFEVAGQASIATDPGERPLDNPPFGQNLKSGSVRSLDDLQSPSTGAPHRHRHFASGISAISKNAFDEREQSSRPTQQLQGAITVLNIGGMNDDVQQEAQRVDQDVPLATLDLLARVVARRSSQDPLFCVPFTVCRSMMRLPWTCSTSFLLSAPRRTSSDRCGPACRPNSKVRGDRAPCSSAVNPGKRPPLAPGPQH